jgi:hypothetical protein
MRKLLMALLATLFLMGGAATLVATAQDATPEADQDALAQGEGNPVDPAIGDTVSYFTEDGEEAGTVTVESIERGWEEYDEFNEPEDGAEYVAFVVTVESTIERGGIDVSDFDFTLQTAQGYLWGTAFASSETADPPLLEDDLSLAAGDSETFTLVFQVYEDEALAHLFWQPDSGVLITAAQLDGE